MKYFVANLFSLLAGKVWGYFVNKRFVYRTKTQNVFDLVKEIFRYSFARGATGFIDYFGLIILVEIFYFDERISKYFLTSIVILLNYIFGKFIVFKRLKRKSHDQGCT